MSELPPKLTLPLIYPLNMSLPYFWPYPLPYPWPWPLSLPQALHDHSQREDLITEMYLRAMRDNFFVPWVQGTRLCDFRGFTLPIAKVVVEQAIFVYYPSAYLFAYLPTHLYQPTTCLPTYIP